MSNCVLIIDDDANLAIALSEILRCEGYETAVATSALAGLRRIQRTMPDIIICDWEMPNFNGGELLRTLRLSEDTKHVPFVIITGHVVSDTDFSPTAILTKPVSIYVLVDIIKQSTLATR